MTKARGPASWWIRLGGVLLVLAALLLAGRFVPLESILPRLEQELADLGWWGPIAYVLIYVLATVCMLPAWPITLVGGAVFGLVRGMLIVSLAATAGAACAFLIARYVAREPVARVVERYPKLAAVDRAVGEQGWKIVALLRLSPAVPFNLQNYFFGLTAIRFVPYVITSWLAMLPGTFLYVYVGYLGGQTLEESSGDRAASAGVWVLRVVGLGAAVLVTFYIAKLARRAVEEEERRTAGMPGAQSRDAAD